MEESIERAVTRAISAMQENLGEPLSVDDLARAAMFSKFHFTRVFQRATGTSPGRFLSALRLQQAKQLLISTSLNVADISMRVGYTSVGTFSSRFSRSVGMSPTAYRRMSGYAVHIPTAAGRGLGQAPTGRVSGRIRFAGQTVPGPVFIGLFPERIPEGRPVRCAILRYQTYFQFDAVPRGSWYLLAQCVGDDDPLARTDGPGRRAGTLSVATCGPLTVGEGAVLRTDVTLCPVSALDPPVLMALLDARTSALSRTDLSRAAGTPADRLSQRPPDAELPAA